MAKTGQNYVNCVHVTLTNTSSNCILPAHGYMAKVTRLLSKRVWLVRETSHNYISEMVEMVEKLEGRLGKRSVERLRYVINNLLHMDIVKYGDISLVLCISTRLRLVTILSLLVKYLVILHADPCNKSYNWASEASPTLGCSIEISRDIYILIPWLNVVPAENV